MELTTNETGTFSYTFTSAPTPIPNGTFTITPADINPATGLFQGDVAVFAGLQAGFYLVEVTSPNGSTCEAAATIFVLDFEAPIVICPQSITVPTDPGTCTTTIEAPPPIILDSCNTTFTTSPQPNGETLYIVTDSNGNTTTAICDVTVSVIDVESPVINCPSDISLTITDGACSATASWGLTASDNCGIGNISTICFYPDGSTASCSSVSQYPIGTTIVTNTATDNSGNASTCSFTITINDNTPNNLFFTGTIQDGIYYANQDIIANGNVPTNGNVGFKAGQCVRLDEGFTVQPGADFSGEIEDCQ